MNKKNFQNPYVLGAAIIGVAGLIAALVPQSGYWPSNAGAKSVGHPGQAEVWNLPLHAHYTVLLQPAGECKR